MMAALMVIGGLAALATAAAASDEVYSQALKVGRARADSERVAAQVAEADAYHSPASVAQRRVQCAQDPEVQNARAALESYAELWPRLPVTSPISFGWLGEVTRYTPEVGADAIELEWSDDECNVAVVAVFEGGRRELWKNAPIPEVESEIRPVVYDKANAYLQSHPIANSLAGFLRGSAGPAHAGEELWEKGDTQSQREAIFKTVAIAESQGEAE